MEENRLKPMPTQYDAIVFNDMYSRTEGLRRKLASQIDYRRFGVEYEDILSWFTVKFIHVFNKYHDEKPDFLLGYIINSLQIFKCRVLREAYKKNYSQVIVSYDDVTELETTPLETGDNEFKEQHLQKLIVFFKNHLCDNAYMLLQLQLNPPNYIIYRLQEQKIPSIHKIPEEIICEYLGLEINQKSIKYIGQLRKEIKTVTSYAKHYFSNQ